MAQQKKRMGSMSLSSFAKSTPQNEPEPTAAPPEASPAKTKPQSKRKPQAEKLATLNIKVTQDQRRWLQDTSQQMRDNNLEPQPPQDRVYPQHLIGVAIELLQSQDVDWAQIRTAEELRGHLNL